MPDDESFGRYVLESYAGLVRRAVLLVGNRVQAEDLVQVSLESAYVHWRKIRQPDAYVRTVMTRKAIDWRARRWNGEVPSEDLPEKADSAPATDPELSSAVRLALMALPADQRAVIVLRYFDDCSEAEIADILRCSPGTVKSRASRGLAALRAGGLLAEEGQLQ